MYSRSPIEDRFRFQTRGTFRCSRPSERILIIICVIAAVLLWWAIFEIWGAQFRYIVHLSDDTIFEGKTPHSLFFAVAFSFFTLVDVIIAGIVIKNITKGIEYHYTADENMFSFYSTKGGIKKTDIHYNDITAINYEQRVLFGMLDRGFTVTIDTRSQGTITFCYIYNKSAPTHGRENTPFYIIEERLKMQNDKLSS